VDLGCREGVPVIVCEKPLTSNLAEARKLVRRIAGFPTKVLVNHERRYARDYRRVRNLVASEVYGRLVTINAKLFMGRGRAPGEVLVWDGTHMVDILRYLTGGEIQGPRAWGNPEVSGGRLTARFLAAGVEVFLETAADRDHLVFELDLGFEGGWIRIGNGLYEEFGGGPSPLYDKMRSLVPVEWEPGSIWPTGYFSGMAADAVESVLRPDHRPGSAASDGLAALEAIEAILRSSGSNLGRISRLKN
jgi:predicted dehydrogenase